MSPLLLAAPPELAPKTQQELTPAEVASLQAPLEKVAMRSWVNVPNDPTRPWHLSVIYTPEGLDVYVVKHQEDRDNLVDRPERYLAMSLHSMGPRVFNLDANRPALPVAGMTRIRQETQPLAGAEADGTVLSNPLADPDLIEYFLNPSGEVGEPGFYDDDFASDPALLFKLLAVNNLIEDPTVPGSFEGNTKPGRRITGELLVKPSGYEKLTPEDFAVFYMLQRVVGATFFSSAGALPARAVISRGADHADNVGRTTYRLKTWPVDGSNNSMLGHVTVDFFVGWDERLRLDVTMSMDVVDVNLSDEILGWRIYARRPPEGQPFPTNPITDPYAVVAPSTPSSGASWDRLLGDTILRHLVLPEEKAPQ